MLKRFPFLAASHLEALNNSLSLLCHKPLNAFMTMLVVAITLTLPAVFWVFSDNLQHLTQNWQQSGHISLYLKTSLTAAEEKTALTKVQAIEGVGKASLKTRSEGLMELKQQEGMTDIMRYLPENPLPAVIEISPKIVDEALIRQLFTRLSALPEVGEAKLDMEWVSRLNAILKLASKTSAATIFLLALAVVLIIGNTLRLTLYHHQEEIHVLRLIGAKNAFIARPFLYLGIWYSLGGAILAVLLVNLLMLGFAGAVNRLLAGYSLHNSFIGLTVKQAYLILLSAGVLGWLGAKVLVSRQLSLIEPYN